MKGLTVVFLLILPFTLVAQGVFNNQTNGALQKVIGDYPNKFRNIKGAVINENPQSVDYASTVKIPGASDAVITKYSADDDRDIYSWKCVLAEGEEFEDIAKKYKSLYQQIKNTIIKVDGEKPFILNGAYEIPTEEKRFVASAFNLLPSTGTLGKLKVELALEYYITDWKITLLVYDQEEESMVMDTNN